MLVERIREFHGKEIGETRTRLNCAETILYAADEEYSLNLDKSTFKAISPFGGGMQIRSVCGALTGALAVIGIMFTGEAQHEGDRIEILTKKFFGDFQARLDSIICETLRENHRDEKTGCLKIIEAAAEVLDNIIKQNEDVLERRTDSFSK